MYRVSRQISFRLTVNITVNTLQQTTEANFVRLAITTEKHFRTEFIGKK
jgi:hypothetical protein